jgi:hypothetical protein
MYDLVVYDQVDRGQPRARIAGRFHKELGRDACSSRCGVVGIGNRRYADERGAQDPSGEVGDVGRRGIGCPELRCPGRQLSLRVLTRIHDMGPTQELGGESARVTDDPYLDVGGEIDQRVLYRGM